MRAVERVECVADIGLKGDRYRKQGGHRQVTIIQWEHLDVVAKLMGEDRIDPHRTRRNLAISGANVLALQDQRFRIGGVEFEGTGLCEPCPRMEVTIGPGGRVAMIGHGGITARILAGGSIHVGDALIVLPQG